MIKSLELIQIHLFQGNGIKYRWFLCFHCFFLNDTLTSLMAGTYFITQDRPTDYSTVSIPLTVISKITLILKITKYSTLL